ncbi:MAG: rod shape-determining protein MreC [Gammaproteobacteria bacterium]|nr:rod shape-determining protein MreC [Gammaproteobacteria bacterium]
MKLIFTQGPSLNTRIVFAVVISLALMAVDHRQNHLEGIRAILSIALSPFHVVTNLPRSTSKWVSETFASLSSLQQQNQDLRKENLLLQVQQQKLDSLKTENMRLRNLLDSAFKIGDRVLIAELIAVDLDPYRHQVLVNKGGNSGIFQGQPALDASAVMGQVTHVNPLSSTVLLITDASHGLPVQVNRNGLRTVALGTGHIDRLELPHLPNNADIEVGDLLVTSGLGGRFPPGYPVAEVTAVTRNPGQPFASVLAQPKAKLDQARETMLVWTLDNPQEQSLPEESAGETGSAKQEPGR